MIIFVRSCVLELLLRVNPLAWHTDSLSQVERYSTRSMVHVDEKT